jgi:hypothetical protein
MLSNMQLHMVQFLELVGLFHSNDMLMLQCVICAHSALGFHLCRDKMILYLFLPDIVPLVSIYAEIT